MAFDDLKHHLRSMSGSSNIVSLKQTAYVRPDDGARQGARETVKRVELDIEGYHLLEMLTFGLCWQFLFGQRASVMPRTHSLRKMQVDAER
jgi:hypothetical protein